MIRQLNKSITYYTKILNSKAFKQSPIKTIFRSFLLCLLIIINKSKIIFFDYKNTKFKFKFMPISKSMGGRGFFIEREKIEPLMEYGLELIKKNDICLDAGANQGIFTMAFASRVGDQGQVFAVEPMEYALEILKENAKINNFQNIFTINKVLSNIDNNEVNLDISDGIGKASISINRGGEKLKKVKTISIDKIFQNQKVDFIKLDIEGAEYLSLLGAEKTLKTYKPIICLECRVRHFNQINSFLINLNYSPHIYDNFGKLKRIETIEEFQHNIFYLQL